MKEKNYKQTIQETMTMDELNKLKLRVITPHNYTGM